MKRYFLSLDVGVAPESGSLSRNVEETGFDGASESATDEDYEEDSDGFEPVDTSDIRKYRDCVVKSSAYEWLRGALLAEIIQTPAVPDVRSELRNKVLYSLRSARREKKMSRARPTESHRIVFELDWDPRSFVEEQGYDEKPEDAIGMAITLTGSTQDCQAMTTSQYLSQTWPSVGSHMMQIIRRVLRGEPSDRHSGKPQPLGTAL
jgi:hypothetical protein